MTRFQATTVGSVNQTKVGATTLKTALTGGCPYRHAIGGQNLPVYGMLGHWPIGRSTCSKIVIDITKPPDYIGANLVSCFGSHSCC